MGLGVCSAGHTYAPGALWGIRALVSLQRHLSPRVLAQVQNGSSLPPYVWMGDLRLPGASHASSGRPSPGQLGSGPPHLAFWSVTCV